jgi:hypothetical protein
MLKGSYGVRKVFSGFALVSLTAHRVFSQPKSLGADQKVVENSEIQHGIQR